MLQERQIVKALVDQVGVEDPTYTKYAIKSFQFVALIIISVIVTMYRTVLLERSYITTSKLRSSI
jgi:hypothetical protein